MLRISHIKTVTDSQWENIVSLEQELHESSKQYPRENLNAMLANDQVFVLAVQDGERIIGMATLYLQQKIDNRAAWVEDVIVSDEYRGRGLGKQLMEELIKTAREEGVLTLNLTSRSSRVAANALYQKLGFEQRDTNVYKMKLL
ncbi:MAG: GNAT family N-acetyltransferase [Candidatus Pacebacteria bacterium]|nr:GNAT family N-acetyltransferase [Candidatus Paceibacterota bacterium]